MGIFSKMFAEKEAVPKKKKEYTGETVDVLIDGDILAYRASAATDGKYYWITSGGKTVQFKYKKEMDAFVVKKGLDALDIRTEYDTEPEAHAIHNLDRSVQRILDSVSEEWKRPVAVYVFTTGDTNFRDEVSSSYKQSRKGVRKPTHLNACKARLEHHWDAMWVDGYEADDLICIESYSRDHKDCVVCSLDKDLLQIPGYNYNWAKEAHELITIRKARNLFWRQVLTGDKTDDIVGLNGIGPVKSQKALDDLFVCDATDYDYYKRCTEMWMNNMPRDSTKDSFGDTVFAESKIEYIQRIMKAMNTSATLLYLCRDYDAPFQPPKKESVSSDTLMRLIESMDKTDEINSRAQMKYILEKSEGMDQGVRDELAAAVSTKLKPLTPKISILEAEAVELTSKIEVLESEAYRCGTPEEYEYFIKKSELLKKRLMLIEKESYDQRMYMAQDRARKIHEEHMHDRGLTPGKIWSL